MTRTLIGKAMIATAANRLAARLVGINTGAIVGLSFAVSAAIGAIGGMLVTPITLTNYDVGTLLALKGFAAAMLGGMGNPLGAVVGGLLVGLLEAFGAGYISSAYKDAIAFLVILGVLFVMPQGLFGRAARRARRRCMPRFCAHPYARRPRARADRRCPAVRRCRRRSICASRRSSSSSPSRCRAEPADGLRRTGQPRPCRLLRHRRLCGRGRTDAFRHSVLGGIASSASRSRACSRSRRPADPEAERPLSRRRDARHRHPDRDGVHQRGALHRRAGRHAGAAAGTVRLDARARPIAWYWISGVTLVIARADRGQPDREPDRPRLPRHP